MDSKQVILITGSSIGFGRLIAETLSRHGHTVFANMRDPAIGLTEDTKFVHRKAVGTA